MIQWWYHTSPSWCRKKKKTRIKGWLNYEDARSDVDLDQYIWTSTKSHLNQRERLGSQIVPAKKLDAGCFSNVYDKAWSFFICTSHQPPLFVFNRSFSKEHGADHLLSNQLPSECFDPSLRNNSSGIRATHWAAKEQHLWQKNHPRRWQPSTFWFPPFRDCKDRKEGCPQVRASISLPSCDEDTSKMDRPQTRMNLNWFNLCPQRKMDFHLAQSTPEPGKTQPATPWMMAGRLLTPS